jgi:replication factor C subunit 2/4
MADNMLSIDGYDDDSCEQIDISGTLSTNNNFVKNEMINQLPWIEKYRPTKMEDVIMDANTLHKIKKIIENKDMPNIIITGIPGIGKTTTIKCIAKGLYGKHMKKAVLELNASDDRGIKTVDDVITNFCKKSFQIQIQNQIPNNLINGNVFTKHKMIILDEADNITEKAQHSINKKMEEYNATTRFAFTCNESSDILEAIQSKCIILRYIRLPADKIVERLKYICGEEKITYTIDALKEIAIISQGDLRSAINNLQAVYNGMNNVTAENVYLVCDKPQPTRLQEILKCCKDKNTSKAFNLMGDLTSSGYSNSDIILGFMNVLKFDSTAIVASGMNELDKNYILKKVSKSAYIVSNGVTTNLQLYSLISSIIIGYKTNKLEI